MDENLVGRDSTIAFGFIDELLKVLPVPVAGKVTIIHHYLLIIRQLIG